MEMLQQPIFWVELGAIIWINLLVSGDNAVMPRSAVICKMEVSRDGAADGTGQLPKL